MDGVTRFAMAITESVAARRKGGIVGPDPETSAYDFLIDAVCDEARADAMVHARALAAPAEEGSGDTTSGGLDPSAAVSGSVYAPPRCGRVALFARALARRLRATAREPGSLLAHLATSPFAALVAGVRVLRRRRPPDRHPEPRRSVLRLRPVSRARRPERGRGREPRRRVLRAPGGGVRRRPRGHRRAECRRERRAMPPVPPRGALRARPRADGGPRAGAAGADGPARVARVRARRHLLRVRREGGAGGRSVRGRGRAVGGGFGVAVGGVRGLVDARAGARAAPPRTCWRRRRAVTRTTRGRRSW